MRLGLNREVAISGLLCSTECALCVSHWDSIMLLVFVLRFSSSHLLSRSPNICHLKSLRRHNDIKGSAVRPPKSLLRGQTDTEINSQPLMWQHKTTLPFLAFFFLLTLELKSVKGRGIKRPERWRPYPEGKPKNCWILNLAIQVPQRLSTRAKPVSRQLFDLPFFLQRSFSAFTTLSLRLLPSGQALHPPRSTNIFFSPTPGTSSNSQTRSHLTLWRLC